MAEDLNDEDLRVHVRSMLERVDALEAEKKALGERVSELEERKLATGRVIGEMVCPSCGDSAIHVDFDRDIANDIVGGIARRNAGEVAEGLTRFGSFLKGVVRSVVYEVGPQSIEPPPYDAGAELSVCARAITAHWYPFDELLHARHFFQPLAGHVWEAARTHKVAPDLGVLARQVELKSGLPAASVLTYLWKLRDEIASRHDPKAVEEILYRAWQRDLHYEAAALAGLLRLQLPGVDVVDVRGRLLDLLGKLDAGPRGEPSFEAIEAYLAEHGKDVSTGAREERRKKYAVQREAVYLIASVVGWLKRDDTPALTDVRARIEGLRARLVTAIRALDDVLAKLPDAKGGKP